MTITPIKPSGIVLLTTLRCTAACDNCCFGCSPKQGCTMTLDEMKGYVDMSLEAYPDTISTLDLTGGECMLLGKDVERIMSYAKSKGLKSMMVSNAFWATDYDKAYTWKSQACLTPEGKAMLTPENFFILTPLKS